LLERPFGSAHYVSDAIARESDLADGKAEEFFITEKPTI